MESQFYLHKFGLLLKLKLYPVLFILLYSFLQFIYYHTFFQLIESRINKRVDYHLCCVYWLEFCILLANIPKFKSQAESLAVGIIFIRLFCLFARDSPHLDNLIHITYSFSFDVWHEEVKILQGDGCWKLFS